MELRKNIAPVLRFVTLVTAFKLAAVSCVPMKYEIGYRNSIDLDAEQTEARYDQGMLSDIMNDERPELQKAESCVADNFKYDHGQKIQRYDPCEICLCIDGEIFCWWKQCDVPAKPELSGNPAPVSLTTPDSDASPAPMPSRATTTTPAATTTTTTATTTSISTTTNTATSDSTLSSFAPPPQLHPGQPDSSVRILHPPSPETIAQNALSFPQKPPIMMHLPAVGVVLLAKNGTYVGQSAALVATSSPVVPGVWDHRNKHSGGPPKKVDILALGGKKSYRKSKSKGYAINYGLRFEGDGGDPSRMVTSVGGERMVTVTERIASADDGDGLAVAPSAGTVTEAVAVTAARDSFDGVRSGSRLTVGLAGEGGAVLVEDDAEDDDEDEDEEDQDDEETLGEDTDERRRDFYGALRSRPTADGERTSGGNAGGEFGGYGYGMIKEPEEDKQQHYIITSSGHVEMFDDTSMEATENAFGINRYPPQQQLLEPAPASTTTTVSSGQPVAAMVFGLDRTPIPPLITMTTNVTQNSNYSNQPPDTASGQPLTPYAPLASSGTGGGSVIDVLNSTVDGGGGGVGIVSDYLDDNQTELIYPAVPGLSGGGGSGVSRAGQHQPKTTGSGSGSSSSGSLAVTTSRVTAVAGGGSTPEQHCVVMGVSYKVGAVLKQETGNCLHCVCVAGPENDPVPRVTCTPLNCPPLILPDILDGAGF